MIEIKLDINNKIYAVQIDESATLLDVLRDELGLTGTKRGCEVGECGACTVIMDNDTVNSCLVLAVQAQGSKITTIEGLAEKGKLHPVQESFLKHDAVHCGFCTPGMVMSAVNLLNKNPHPDEKEIKEALAGNLCRCTGYTQIIKAVKQVPSK